MISRQFSSPAPRGFTLLELMVVVAILGILAVIAIPSYAEYVQRSRIIDATSRLSDFRVRMEQFFLDNRRYTKVAGGNACGIDDPPLVGSDPFQISCTPNVAGANTYRVVATGQSGTNMQAFQYSIDQLGTKTTDKTKWGGKVVGCWVVRADGSCV